VSLQPGSRSVPQPYGPQHSFRLGDGLAWLGGADRELLQLSRSGRGQFIQMGLVVLATAGLGVMSMSFALFNALHLETSLAIAGGVFWGCVIAVIDRFLITNLNLRGGVWHVVIVVGVRVLIAALLGLVISTPLVLQVFQREIQAQVVLTNATANTSFGDLLQLTPIADELSRIRGEIATNEAVLLGQVPVAASPEAQSREQYLKQAQDRLQVLQATSDEKYRAWQCELYGSSCEGSTNVPGNGNLAQAREQEYRDALSQTDAARQDVADASAALEVARQSASDQGGEALRAAQDAANAALPGLRTRAAELQVQYDEAVDTGNKSNQDNNGILAQIVALNELSEHNTETRLTHLAVGLLFFMIELLPVLVKILSSLGPPSAYERVREMADNSKVDDAKINNRRKTRERDEEELRITAEARKRTAIEDDMRARELNLGTKANSRVAQEMEKVLDVALAEWALDVQRTLSAVPVAPPNGSARTRHNSSSGAGKTSSVPHPPNGASSSSRSGAQPLQNIGQVRQNVRSNYNLPRGDKLGPPNGGQP